MKWYAAIGIRIVASGIPGVLAAAYWQRNQETALVYICFTGAVLMFVLSVLANMETTTRQQKFRLTVVATVVGIILVLSALGHMALRESFG